MEFKDLIFYLYPIAREYELDLSVDFIDPFLYSLDTWTTKAEDCFTRDDHYALKIIFIGI